MDEKCSFPPLEQSKIQRKHCSTCASIMSVKINCAAAHCSGEKKRIQKYANPE